MKLVGFKPGVMDKQSGESKKEEVIDEGMGEPELKKLAPE